MVGSPEIDRRTLLMLLGATMLAACADSSSHSTVSSTTSSTDTAVSSTAPTSASETVTLGGSAVAPSHRFDAHALQTAQRYAGTWMGSWVDDAGSRGTFDVIGTVDAAARVVTVKVAVTGRLFGGPAPSAVTYRVKLDSYAADADAWQANTPQFGSARYDTSSRVITFTDLPGHPDIASVNVETQLGDRDATMAIHVLTRSGSTSRAAVALSRDRRPPTPSLAAAGGEAEFVHGDYAANLVTQAELAAAFGRAAEPAESNGGNPAFGSGLQTSNGRATSADGHLIVQWTVYRSTTLAGARAYFALNTPVATAVSGLGDAAQTVNGALQVLRYREVIQLSVLDTTSAVTAAALSAMSRQLVVSMLPRMTQR
jgi:hypothetical protein